MFQRASNMVGAMPIGTNITTANINWSSALIRQSCPITLVLLINKKKLQIVKLIYINQNDIKSNGPFKTFNNNYGACSIKQNGPCMSIFMVSSRNSIRCSRQSRSCFFLSFSRFHSHQNAAEKFRFIFTLFNFKNKLICMWCAWIPMSLPPFALVPLICTLVHTLIL